MAGNGVSQAYNFAETGQNNMRYNKAPRIKEFPNEAPKPVVKPHLVKKSRNQLILEARVANARAMKTLIISIVLLSFIGLLIYSRIQLDQVSRQIEKEQSQLSVMESENTRLNMKLDSVTSLDKVEDYAVNTLGMVKQNEYQVEYVNLKGADKVVLSGGKEASSKSGFNFINIWNKVF